MRASVVTRFTFRSLALTHTPLGRGEMRRGDEEGTSGRAVARMMPAVLEDSVEAFIARFQAAAADVTLSSHVEGSPLLECIVAGHALHLFERTGPYLARLGPARVILNAECDALERVDEEGGEARIDIVGVSAIDVTGTVLRRDDPFVVVDAGAPIVVGVTAALDGVEPGDRVRFVSRPPLHGFVLPRPTARERANLDDQV
jgi:hypothetical protein